MVGVAVNLMDVRHLDYGQQRQQDKAHHSNHRQSTEPCAAFPAEISLKSCQQNIPCIKDTHYSMRGMRSGLRIQHVFDKGDRKRSLTRFV
jgi:hypothetical protein